MITSSRKKDFEAKQEGDSNDGKFSKAPSSSRQWSGFKNPRIVRVSRNFGGKDRHSKVCTIRGLRDRRIRLSVPTAIQLYDLQDRLGLNQPSKVIDWLLDATKHEIDKLPPLQMPPGNFDQFYQPTLVSHEPNALQSSLAPFFDANWAWIKDGGTHSLLSGNEGIRINNNVDGEAQTIMAKSKCLDSDAASRAKGKEVERETIVEKTKRIKIDEQGSQDGIVGYTAQVSAQNFFPIVNHSSLPAGLLNNAMPYNSYYQWEPSNLSLSQFGSHGYPFQTEDPHNNNALSLPSSLAIPSGSQLFFCPSATAPSFFPPYPPYLTTPVESDPRQINQHFQLLSSSSQHILPNSLMPSLHSINSPMRSHPLNVNPKFLHSQNNNERQPNEDNNGS